MSTKNDQKTLKKLVKAENKKAKKKFEPAEPSIPAVSADSPAERSATAAERQLVLHRWKVFFAGVSALIALITLGVLLLR